VLLWSSGRSLAIGQLGRLLLVLDAAEGLQIVVVLLRHSCVFDCLLCDVVVPEGEVVLLLVLEVAVVDGLIRVEPVFHMLSWGSGTGRG